MANIIFPISSPLALAAPRVPICIRPGTLADIPFIDELQKVHQKMLGFTPRGTLEQKIAAGHVLVAEKLESAGGRVLSAEQLGPQSSALNPALPLGPQHSELSTSVPLGYSISQDRYMGRDDCGVIYQLNVRPGTQRHLVGATLVKTIFERAAYGCRLFCCWCAQDIEANWFWESIGFVPLAFRSGNRRKQRTHIFWQRRVREDDQTTPYWFPAQTRGGMMNEARLVLPIPPGTCWRDAKPMILPGEESLEERRRLPGTRKLKPPKNAPVIKRNAIMSGGLRFVTAGAGLPAVPGQSPVQASRNEPKRKMKNDPKLVAAARELRDRWLEQVGAVRDGAGVPLRGKYNVSRSLTSMRAESPNDRAALDLARPMLAA